MEYQNIQIYIMKNSWPIAFQTPILEPSAPPEFPICDFCNCIATNKCTLCKKNICVYHLEYFPIQNEWCVSYVEYAYYSALIFCKECKEIQTTSRRKTICGISMCCLFIFLFIIIIMISFNQSSN